MDSVHVVLHANKTRTIASLKIGPDRRKAMQDFLKRSGIDNTEEWSIDDENIARNKDGHTLRFEPCVASVSGQ